MPPRVKPKRATLPPEQLDRLRAQEREAYARRAEHHRERHHAYYAKNRAAVLAQKASRRLGVEGDDIRERGRVYQATRYATIPWMAAACKANAKAWKRKNPNRRRELEMRRNARKRATTTEPVDYDRIWRESRGVCGICKHDILIYDQIHFDHIVPLARGGTHTRDNIQVAHAVCNLKKQDKLTYEVSSNAA